MTTPSRRLAALIAAVLVFAGLATSHLAAATSEGPADPFARGRAAIARIGARLQTVAQNYGMSAEVLSRIFDTDPTLAVDQSGQLVYIDRAVPGETAAAISASAAVDAPPTTGAEFQLASLPGADKVIYLDFDGHVTSGTSWNNSYGDPIVTNPFDTDGNFDTWSAGELATIRNAWAAVAEDFAPWNINVTTIEPPLADLAKSGSGDTKWGARVVITQDTFAACKCGGFAYVGSFTASNDTPTFVFNTSAVGISEAASHEVGHMLGLSHDGTATDGYYLGHSSAETPGWAPIMGAGYYQPVTQWSKGEYYSANQTQDDTAIIGNATNGFGLRADDHGDTLGAATPFTSNNPSDTGIIGTRTDLDSFSFTTAGGAVSFDAVPAGVRPNLDITLTLRDSLGRSIVSANPATALPASIATTLTVGTYSLEVSAAGAGSPLLSPPTGFTDYANIGQYTVSGTIETSGPPDLQAPATPTGLGASATGSSALVTWNANTEPDLAAYVLRRSTTAGGPFTELATVPSGTTSYTDSTAPQGPVYYVIAARDGVGNTSSFSSAALVTLPYISRATAGQRVSGTVSGSISDTHTVGGSVQTITEVLSRGSFSKRYDLAEYRWTIPAVVGSQTLAVAASVVDGGDGDSGFHLEWSSNGSTWRRLTTVTAASPVNTSFAIGAPTGNVLVRVIDTNRSAGNSRLDRISVDFLQIAGDGLVPPSPTKAYSSLVTSTRSSWNETVFGVATVRVTNDLGQPIVGASATVTFAGSFNETRSGTTDSSGSAVISTKSSLLNPTFSACVATVTGIGSLALQSGPGRC